MRLTVGPLPPAVYWRRRALVLGALLATVFLLIYSCGGKKSGATDNEGGRPSTKPSTTASGKPLTPLVGSGGPTSAPPASTGPSEAAPPAASLSGACTDAELEVAVSTEGNKTEYVAGAFVRIHLKIKNVSTRTCTRDVGGTPQELRIMQGTKQLWSSDDCDSSGGSNIRTLAPGQELNEFSFNWNGTESTNCQTRPVPPPGTYQLTGRVGTKWSEPVTLTLTAAAQGK
jgi:hypothetical protein